MQLYTRELKNTYAIIYKGNERKNAIIYKGNERKNVKILLKIIRKGLVDQPLKHAYKLGKSGVTRSQIFVA